MTRATILTDGRIARLSGPTLETRASVLAVATSVNTLLTTSRFCTVDTRPAGIARALSRSDTLAVSVAESRAARLSAIVTLPSGQACARSDLIAESTARAILRANHLIAGSSLEAFVALTNSRGNTGSMDALRAQRTLALQSVVATIALTLTILKASAILAAVIRA